MHFRPHASVRADGRLYVLLLGDAPLAEEAVPRISACLRGARESVPAEIFPFSGRLSEHFGTNAAYVAVLPYFSRCVFEVSLERDSEKDSFSVSCSRARWESSYRYRFDSATVNALKGYQQDWVAGRFRPTLDRFLRGDGCEIWRVCVSWAGDCAVSPELRLVTPPASGADRFVVHVFEDQRGTVSSDGVAINRMFYSIELPVGCREFALEAFDKEGRVGNGFCSCDDRFWHFREFESWDHMRDARADDERYASWISQHAAGPGLLHEQRCESLAPRGLFSVVVPCYRSDRAFLQQTVHSVMDQSYPHWELLLVDGSPQDGIVRSVAAEFHDDRIRVVDAGESTSIVGNTNEGIRHATGDFISFLDHDDVLEPDALFCYARVFAREGARSLLFCDEDLFTAYGAWRQPIFKTRLNLDLLYSHNCVTHFLCVGKEVIDEIGCSDESVCGAQDYDLTLRAVAAGVHVEHVPRVLYHWREHEGSTSGDNAQSKPYAVEAGRLALERHFDHRGIPAEITSLDAPFVYRVSYGLPQESPWVTVVIPSRDHSDVLERCVRSVFQHAGYEHFDVLVVENHSSDRQTFDCYERLGAEFPGRFSVFDASDLVTGFNYSKLINLGVARARGEYLLLLNNDTEAITDGFIPEMLGYLMRPEVGVVGARLFFADGLVQHAGVLVGPHGAVAHCNQDLPRSWEGYLSRSARPGNFSAVTGACQMVSRRAFDEVGGYDEQLAVGFNDVDFCFALRARGYLVVYTPYAELYHHEFVSRGREVVDAEKLVRWKREQALFTAKWPDVFIDGDPYTNPNLNKDSAYFGL